MSKPEHITFDEFAANLSAVFERIPGLSLHQSG